MALSLEIFDEAGRYQECEHEPDERHEKRRLDEEVVEALPVRVEERDAVGLDEGPDEAAGDRQRAE
jgi:hypothetical protein